MFWLPFFLRTNIDVPPLVQKLGTCPLADLRPVGSEALATTFPPVRIDSGTRTSLKKLFTYSFPRRGFGHLLQFLFYFLFLFFLFYLCPVLFAFYYNIFISQRIMSIFENFQIFVRELDVLFAYNSGFCSA